MPTSSQAPSRHFPVRPNLDQLRHQAKDLLASIHAGEPASIAELHQHFPTVEPSSAKLAHAQFALARSYGIVSWPRLVTACKLIDAIWKDDLSAILELVTKNPNLLHEDARGVTGNWGPPLSYAANLGRDTIISALRTHGSVDIQHAFGRACLQGQLATARLLLTYGAHLVPGEVMGPCETLSSTGLKFLLDLGAELADAKGDRLAPVALILQTYSRNPPGKHGCLELVQQQGIELPDNPPMAVHRGRIDLLEQHLLRDPGLLSRTFTHHEIFPLALGCSPDPTYALHGTPLAGGTLLHLAVDYDELEIAAWLLSHGCDPNIKALIDADGFGGHTPLYGTVVSQPYRNGLQKDGAFTAMLLNRGADPDIRASLRKQLRFVKDETLHEYRNITAIEWGEQFQDQDWVNPKAIELIRTRINDVS